LQAWCRWHARAGLECTAGVNQGQLSRPIIGGSDESCDLVSRLSSNLLILWVLYFYVTVMCYDTAKASDSPTKNAICVPLVFFYWPTYCVPLDVWRRSFGTQSL
jgi:hypothetical protein